MNANALPDITFPGRNKLVALLDAAVSSGDEHQVTAALRNALSSIIPDSEIQLPECVSESIEGHYARREIYRSAQHGYSVVAMTWGPGQGTPVHDHCGLWCVEGVWQGGLDITQYELLERAGERFRFRGTGGMIAGPGSAGSLIPPHEYHAIRNSSADRIAISVHIYKEPMEACAMFVPAEGEWFTRVEKALPVDL